MYKVSKNKETNLFEVLEIETNQIVFKSKNYAEASLKYRFFNRGGFFNGLTPTFFLNDHHIRILKNVECD